MSLIQIVKAAQAVDAVQRKPEEYETFTFFSMYDQWEMHMVFDNRTCKVCAAHLHNYAGNELRTEFPFLEIIDRDLIKLHAHMPRDDNCRCYVLRVANPMDPRSYEPEERERVKKYGT